MTSARYYQQLLDLSQRMLAEGMAQRWEKMIDLAQQRRTLFAQGPDAATAVVSPADKALIAQIQACDAQLSEKLEAWLSDVRILLRMDQPTAT